jgi:hypothetical protein
MKTKLRAFFILALVSFAILACEGPIGPEGPQGAKGDSGAAGAAGVAGAAGGAGAAGATGAAGAAGAGVSTVVSYTVGTTWTSSGTVNVPSTFYKRETGITNVTAISSSVMSTGIVLAFFSENGGTDYWQLPKTYPLTGGVGTEIVDFRFKLNGWTLSNFREDSAEPSVWTRTSNRLRIVIINNPGGRIDVNAIKRMSWPEVENFLKSSGSKIEEFNEVLF